MMPTKSQSELDSILNQFEIPKLWLDDAREVGPDERLYLLHDARGYRFGVWARDHMSELYIEAQSLSTNQKIEVAKWFRLKNTQSDDDNDHMAYSDGVWYAVFLLQ